jgi:ketosteroid isomerase-like protein
MKKFLFVTAFIAWTMTALAGRPTTDEMAARLGVQAWFSTHSPTPGSMDVTHLKAIYRPEIEFTNPVSANAATEHGVKAYSAVWQPLADSVETFSAKLGDDLQVTTQGSKIVTTFTYRPQGVYKDGRQLSCNTRVSLTWERPEGFWQITREVLTPLDPATATPSVATTK